jgi:Tfp pilus assembly protein PilF
VQEFNKRAWPEFLIARGRPAEALEAAKMLAAHPTPVVSAIGHIEAGRAQLALGQFKAAADESNAALRLMRGAPEGAGLAATPLKALQGEFFLRTGKKEQGRPLLEQAAREVRAAPGPDAWTQALFALESIAGAARQVGDWEFADWAAKQMLEHDAQYAGSHLARALVAEHRGDAKTAAAERALAAKYWSGADRDVLNRK